MSNEIVYSKKLSPQQAAEFATLERTAIEGRQVFYVVGAALGTIKEKKYYLNKGFETFALYAESIGFSKRHCDQLILDSEAVKSLPVELRKLITSGNAAKALAKVPTALRPTVVKAASEGKSAATAQAITKASSSVPQRKVSKIPTRKQAEPEILDETGIPIPKEVLPLWLAAKHPEDGVNQLLLAVSRTRCFLRAVRDNVNSKYDESDEVDKRKMFAEVDLTECVASLQRVETELELAIPWAVCPSCQGKLAEGCLTCKSRGFVSKFYWTVKVPEETRMLRPKGWKQ